MIEKMRRLRDQSFVEVNRTSSVDKPTQCLRSILAPSQSNVDKSAQCWSSTLENFFINLYKIRLLSREPIQIFNNACLSKSTGQKVFFLARDGNQSPVWTKKFLKLLGFWPSSFLTQKTRQNILKCFIWLCLRWAMWFCGTSRELRRTIASGRKGKRRGSGMAQRYFSDRHSGFRKTFLAKHAVWNPREIYHKGWPVKKKPCCGLIRKKNLKKYECTSQSMILQDSP